MILNITDSQRDYTSSLNEVLLESGFRSECDLTNEKIGYKIRNHAMTRVPYMLIVGEKELENKTVSVRDRAGNDLGDMTIDAFTDLLNKEIS
jgi:threonyl-tRNA synthetase